MAARARAAVGSPTENVLARLVALSIMGKVGSLVAGFFASIALARLLGPANRGLIGLMISVSSVALVITTFGVPLAVLYFAARKDADQGALLGNSLLEAAVLAVVLVVAAALFYPQIADAFAGGHGGTTWILVAALVAVTFLDWTTHAQLQGLLMFGRFNALLIISRFTYVAAILILIGLLGLGVAGGVIATAIASAVTIAGSVGPVLRRGRPRLDLRLARRTVRYGLRVQIGSVFQITNGRLDVIIVQFFRPLTQVGYYVVAQTIAELVLNLAFAFQSSVLPLIANYGGNDARAEETSISSLRHHSLLAGVAVLFNAVFGPLMIYFAFGSKYQAAILPMLILLPGVWFLGMGIVIQGDLAGRGRPGVSSLLAGVSAAVTVILDLSLIPWLGIYGGAIASDIAYTTFGVGSLIALHRVTQVPIRQLAVPTKAEFALYPAAIRQGWRALRSRHDRPE